MTRISENQVNSELDQGRVTIYTGGSERLRFQQSGTAVWSVSATDQSGVRVVGITGGTATAITSGSAATAGGTSALSSFTIAHGLSVTPTNFNVAPADAQAALVPLLGSYVTADGTNVYLNTVSAVTASKAYTFQWWASP